MDTMDWRGELHPRSRKRAIKRIMNAVKQYHNLDDKDELQELEKFSRSFEQKTFAGATSKSEYVQKINSKKVEIDSKSSNLVCNSLVQNKLEVARRNRPKGKLREEIDQKIQMFKEVYLPDLIEMSQIIASRRQPIQMLKEVHFTELTEMFQRFGSGLQQLDSLPQQAVSDNCKEPDLFKGIFESISSFIALSKWVQSPSFKSFKDELVSYEEEIINLINKNRPWKMYYLQRGQVPPHAIHSLTQPQSQLSQVYSHGNEINSQSQFQELYQKIQMLKEMYLPELNEMHQIVANKLQQTTELDKREKLSLDSLPKLKVPPAKKPYKNERRKILKIKEILERIIPFLQASESDISPALKEKLPLYEKQITTFITINRSKGCQVCFGYKIPVPSSTGDLQEFVVSESDFS